MVVQVVQIPVVGEVVQVEPQVAQVVPAALVLSSSNIPSYIMKLYQQV
jgi:hypothetical protein